MLSYRALRGSQRTREGRMKLRRAPLQPELFTGTGTETPAPIPAAVRTEAVQLLGELLREVVRAHVHQLASVEADDGKISTEHLARGAYVYVRQSTADQLQHNHESRRRQSPLAERARGLGWSEVVVIDDDLGVSASGVVRPGFERLLAAICRGSVGAVVSIEASDLAPVPRASDLWVNTDEQRVRWARKRLQMGAIPMSSK